MKLPRRDPGWKSTAPAVRLAGSLDLVNLDHRSWSRECPSGHR